MRDTRNVTMLAAAALAALLLFTASHTLATDPETESSCCCAGTATPGYWVNHPDAWPTDSILIGGVVYSKDDAIALMGAPTKGDKTLTMFPAYVAAVLNVVNGAGCDDVMPIIDLADAWLDWYKPGDGVKASSNAWKCGEPLYLILDAYNNGELCASSRDALETQEEPLETEASCCPPCLPAGTATPGYWVNHPDAWPADSILINGVVYSKDDAIALMGAPTKGDKTLTMFPAYVAAVLNVVNGAGCDEIMDVIAAADAWLATYPPQSGVKASSYAWKCGEPLYLTLDAYNNGELCASSRDELETQEEPLEMEASCLPPCPSPGTATPGYWVNHSDAWPVDSILVGNVRYWRDEAIELMGAPTKGDKTLTMFPAYVAAVLNVVNGAGCDEIMDVIAAADAWLVTCPPQSGVKASSHEWKCGEPLYSTLDAYNNGELCAPSRDGLVKSD